jgi:hypothetical protein
MTASRQAARTASMSSSSVAQSNLSRRCAGSSASVPRLRRPRGAVRPDAGSGRRLAALVWCRGCWCRRSWRSPQLQRPAELDGVLRGRTVRVRLGAFPTAHVAPEPGRSLSSRRAASLTGCQRRMRPHRRIGQMAVRLRPGQFERRVRRARRSSVGPVAPAERRGPRSLARLSLRLLARVATRDPSRVRVGGPPRRLHDDVRDDPAGRRATRRPRVGRHPCARVP